MLKNIYKLYFIPMLLFAIEITTYFAVGSIVTLVYLLILDKQLSYKFAPGEIIIGTVTEENKTT
jgi:hypothetical protein